MVKEKLKKGLIRYDYIDALRGLAIIGVLLAHTSLVGTILYPSWLYNLTSIYVGPRGVQLFFVISAFTLYLSWSKRKSSETHVLRNFYIRRFFRIAPLFYVALIYFLYIQNYWSGNPYHFSILNILTTMLFINGAVPPWINNIVYGGWSIAVEMTFYLFFPFIVSKLLSIRTAVITTLIAMLGAQIVRLSLNNILILRETYSTYTFQFFLSQLPLFLIGITVFLLLKTSWTHADRKFLKLFTIFFAILLFIQLTCKIPIIAGHYLYGIFFGALLYFLSIKPIRLLVNPITIHIGKVSYSIYLCHIAILYLLAKLNLVDFFPQFPLFNFFLRFLLLLAVSTTVATILFYVVERSGQIIGKKIIDSHEKSPTNEINIALKTW